MGGLKFETVAQYIESFPVDTQKRLKKLETIIKKKVPGVTSRISYNIPGFFLDGKMVVYFAGFKNHVSIYPVPSGPAYDKLYEGYTTSGKGTIQFPNDEPLPVELIEKIMAIMIERHAERVTASKKTTSKKSAVKKVAAKTSTKTASKKSAAKKSVAKKSATKKTGTKRSAK